MAGSNGTNGINGMYGKKMFVWLHAALAAAGIIALIAVSYAVCRWARSLQPARTVTVSSEGISVVKPDIAMISFSVVSEGANPTALQNDNNKKINDAIALVKGFGIKEEDIQTSGYSLSPRYQYNPKTGRSSIDGYTLTQTVNVKIRDLDNAGKVLGGLPSVGINQLSGPNFSVEDPEKYLNEARGEAFVKARAKATALARLNNVFLGSVVSFSENQGGGYLTPMYAKAEGAGGDSGIPPQIEQGSEEVRVQVSVTFEIW